MISRNLWNRLKRLEDKIKPRSEPQATPKQLQLIERLHAARRRMALEDGKTYVEPEARAEIIYPPGVDPMVMILNSARKKMNEENARLKQEAAADASERNTRIIEGAKFETQLAELAEKVNAIQKVGEEHD